MTILPILLFFIDRYFYSFLGGRLLFLIGAISVIFIYLIFNKLKVTKDFLILAFLFFMAFLINIIFIQNFSLHTGYITIYMRLLYGAVLFSYLLLNKKKNISFFFLAGSIFYLILFESGVFFFKSLNPIININEILVYLLILLILLPFFKNVSNRKRLLLLLLVVLIILFSGSRQNILALMVGALLLLIYNFRHFYLKKIISNALYIFLLFLPLVYFAVTFIDPGEVWLNKLSFFNFLSEDFLKSQYSGDMKRVEALIFVLDSLTINSFLFGHGLGSSIGDWGKDVVFHNGYLTTVYELGVFGLLAIIYMTIATIKPFIFSLTHNNIDYAYVVSASFLPGISIQGMFIEVLSKPTLFIAFGISLALLRCMKIKSNAKGF
jgi:hypothetical protein